MTREEHKEIRELIELRVHLLQTLVEENIQSASDTTTESWPLSPKDPLPSVEQKVIENAQHEILELTQTLIWLDTEQAGLCEQCGNAIEIDKLKSAPTNRCCAYCTEQNSLETIGKS